MSFHTEPVPAHLASHRGKLQGLGRILDVFQKLKQRETTFMKHDVPVREERTSPPILTLPTFTSTPLQIILPEEAPAIEDTQVAPDPAALIPKVVTEIGASEGVKKAVITKIHVSDEIQNADELGLFELAWGVWNENISCLVCANEMIRVDLPSVAPTKTCQHQPLICASCLGHYVEERIEENFLSSVPCPVSTCMQLMDNRDIAIWADVAKLRRRDALIARHRMEEDPNYVPCLNPLCESGKLHAGGAYQPMVTCSECRSSSCFTHRVPWHAGLTCAQYDMRRQPNWVPCINSACQSGAVHVGGDANPWVICSSCVWRYCIKHRLSICAECHIEPRKLIQKYLAAEEDAIRSLKERQTASENRDPDSLRYLKLSTRPCPGCTRRIYKDGGCSHMSCTCGRSFNWY